MKMIFCRLQDRFTLKLPPLLSWEEMRAWFAARLVPGVEVLDGTTLRQAVRLAGVAAVLETRPPGTGRALQVRVFSSAPVARADAEKALAAQFDLDAPMRKVNAALKADPALAPLIARRPGLRVPGTPDPYMLAIRAVLGQQVSVKGATTLAGRLVARYGEPIAPPEEEGVWPAMLFPAAERLAAEKIEGLGTPGKRAATLSTLARFAAESGFAALEDDPAPVKTLEALPGIGPWSAHYIALRALHLRDAFPASDLGLRYAAGGFLGAVPSARELDLYSARWAPYRGHAAIHLWAGLQDSNAGAKGG